MLGFSKHEIRCHLSRLDSGFVPSFIVGVKNCGIAEVDLHC